MTALAAGIQRPYLPGWHRQRIRVPLKASTTILPGAIVAVEASTGLGVNASSGTTTLAGLRVAGVYEESVSVTSSSVDGDTLITVYRCAYAIDSAGSGDAVTQAHFLTRVYLTDNNTIANGDGDGGSGATRPVAGRVVQIDSSGIYVDLGDQP